jgi:GNAT superfamily N-acetyltransferase
MTSTRIRPADIQDAASMAELSEQLGYPSLEQDLVERLSLVLDRDDHLVLAADLSGKVVGWLHACVAFRLESSAFVEIGGLVVAQSERGRGIGQQLVRASAQWARRKGIPTLRVRSHVMRKETHGFYLHLGFEPLKAQMVFSMTPDVGAEHPCPT